MANILDVLINASEKAACITRACLNDGSKDEELLVVEKVEGEANARFKHDFKTIADVLAQQTICSYIAERYPDLSRSVRGEECDEIGGIQITVRETVEETAEMLAALVEPGMAQRMAEAAHRDTDHGFCDKIPKNMRDIEPSELGVWIDPIDGTAEFIDGVRGEAEEGRGLPCVTVLIGAYLKSTGIPVAGVINQPFYNNGKGRVAWGIKHEDIQEWGVSEMGVENVNAIFMSGAEPMEVVEKLDEEGWEVHSAPGAGNKLLKVVLGEAAAYIVTQGTTFRWDTCGPHAILLAKGGNLIDFNNRKSITYYEQGNKLSDFCNSDGIIAYSDPAVYEKLKDFEVKIPPQCIHFEY